jgi:hypothetical protein
MTGDGKHEPGRLERWRAQRELKRKHRANRPPPLLDPEQRARAKSRQHNPTGQDSSAWGTVGFGGGDGGP